MRQLLLLVLFLMQVKGFAQPKNTALIYFKFDQFNLDAGARHTLDSILLKYPSKKFALRGHCDSIGNHPYNDTLSMRRVQKVKTYLMANHISEKNIEIKALGKRAPLNKNHSAKERAMNRRVEISWADKNAKFKPYDTTHAKPVVISGKIVDEKHRPLKAELTLTDENGKVITQVTTQEDGKFNINAKLNKLDKYYLMVYNDHTFIRSKTIYGANLVPPFKALEITMASMHSGDKFILENMQFEGDTAQLMPYSQPIIESLLKLMLANQTLKISIEGHVNYPLSWQNDPREHFHSTRGVPAEVSNDHRKFNQWLSIERAKMVYNYLSENGVDKSRMSYKGFSADKMLYPNAVNEIEMEKNRRVEIRIL